MKSEGDDHIRLVSLDASGSYQDKAMRFEDKVVHVLLNHYFTRDWPKRHPDLRRALTNPMDPRRRMLLVRLDDWLPFFPMALEVAVLGSKELEALSVAKVLTDPAKTPLARRFWNHRGDARSSQIGRNKKYFGLVVKLPHVHTHRSLVLHDHLKPNINVEGTHTIITLRDGRKFAMEPLDVLLAQFEQKVPPQQ